MTLPLDLSQAGELLMPNLPSLSDVGAGIGGVASGIASGVGGLASGIGGVASGIASGIGGMLSDIGSIDPSMLGELMAPSLGVPDLPPLGEFGELMGGLPSFGEFDPSMAGEIMGGLPWM